MGRVFPTETVAQGLVPPIDGPLLAAEAALSALTDPDARLAVPLEVRDHIDRVLAFGSAAMTGPDGGPLANERSDVDLLVVTKNREDVQGTLDDWLHADSRAKAAIGGLVAALQAEFGVIVSPMIESRGSLLSPTLTDVTVGDNVLYLGQQMLLRHFIDVAREDTKLRWQRGGEPIPKGWLDTDPIKWGDVADCAMLYMGAKAAFFERTLAAFTAEGAVQGASTLASLTTNPNRLVKALGYAFEAPRAIARHVNAIATLDEKDANRTIRDTDWGYNELLSHTSDPVQKIRLDMLRLWDQQYTDVLRAAVAQDIPPEAYDTWLAERAKTAIRISAEVFLYWEGRLRQRARELGVAALGGVPVGRQTLPNGRRIHPAGRTRGQVVR